MVDKFPIENIILHDKEFLYHSDLLENLQRLEQRCSKVYLGKKNKVAVFDLDNTLLIGDIGDAVYAELLIQGLTPPLSWSDYQHLVQANPTTAYTEAARALDGISVYYLMHLTKSLILSGARSIIYDGIRIPVPVPNRIMQQVIQILREWKYLIYIISASNDISAKVAGSILFDVPINNIAGIKSEIVDGKLTSKILDPVPISDGKVLEYHQLGGNILPMIVASDSEMDFPLFQICDPEGLVILAGENDELYKKARTILPDTVNIHRIPGRNISFFQQQCRVG